MSHYHNPPIGYVSKVSLQVLDLTRSIEFYTMVIGLNVFSKDENQANFTSNGNNVLLTIHQLSNGIKKQSRTTGLYHFALLLPSRKELGKILNHFIKNQIPLQGASDHGISEAIYLSDPDGNGIEIAVDTPSSTWKWQAGLLDVFSNNGPLDVKAVLDASQNETYKGLPSDTIIGHIHLHGSELKNIRRFYEEVLGMDVVIDLPTQALFFSYGKYHHHLAVNVWNGMGAPIPDKNSVGLRNFEIKLPEHITINDIKKNLHQLNSPHSLTEKGILVRDPSGNNILITS
ncbi:MAG: VOC family protein [Erysipelotrichaceae bacterium]|nr:VOC family protein [Erysipelotrichaceae bacterium]MDP3304527.1 VOC family protein [Erysipelotrichaceae bacterium]